MKILFVIGNLGGGGAERVLALIANELVQRNLEVTIVTYSPDCAYELDKSIIHIPVFNQNEIKENKLLDKINRRISFYPRLAKLLKEQRPDVVISFMKGMNRKVIPVSRLLGIPVIVSEHTNHKVGMDYLSWFERRWIYKLADAVTVLTKYDYEMYYKFFLDNVVVMPNPVTFKSVEELGKKDNTLFAAGSLDRWNHKGFDNLLIVFSRVAKKYPGWVLKIAGAGEDGEKYLRDLAKELEIDKKVIFLGFSQNVSKEFKSASIYALTSRYEGFPMVLIEAMSQGCACVSYDCVSGPNEIITDGVDGVLVEDQNLHQMEEAICELMQDERNRQKLAIIAAESIKQFSIEKTGDRWFGLIESIVDNTKVKQCVK